MTNAEPVRYLLDAARSRFTVRALSGGMLSTLSHNPTLSVRDFTGEAQFVPGTMDAASVRISIKADSLKVIDDVSDKDRNEIERTMREEVLETVKYPEITFESTTATSSRIFESHYRVSINGKLSLHGVSRDCPIEAQVIVSEDSIRANGEFTLLQSHYRIKPFAAAGGTIKLKDELKFSFDIVGRQESQFEVGTPGSRTKDELRGGFRN